MLLNFLVPHLPAFNFFAYSPSLALHRLDLNCEWVKLGFTYGSNHFLKLNFTTPRIFQLVFEPQCHWCDFTGLTGLLCAQLRGVRSELLMILRFLVWPRRHRASRHRFTFIGGWTWRCMGSWILFIKAQRLPKGCFWFLRTLLSLGQTSSRMGERLVKVGLGTVNGLSLRYLGNSSIE